MIFRTSLTIHDANKIKDILNLANNFCKSFRDIRVELKAIMGNDYDLNYHETQDLFNLNVFIKTFKKILRTVLENEERVNEIRVIKREAVKAEKEKESLEFQLSVEFQR